MEKKLDIRLYKYEDGKLKKLGYRNTGLRPHFFNSIEECEEYINKIKENWMSKRSTSEPNQYVIVQYYEPYSSRIVKIIN